MKITPWPHSPAIIARVEIYAESGRGSFPEALNSYYEVITDDANEPTAEVWTHARAVEEAESLKFLGVLGYGGDDRGRL